MNEDLKAKIVRAALLKKYQTEEIFVLKTAQFQGKADQQHHPQPAARPPLGDTAVSG